ncbi:ribose 5-phosphate isomerase B [Selenomonas sp. TAMA-11512]|uniref:RpiB/LacA/LacB family sugar-phosphate isomerase n=1 Tax=Selenomonas sp. TAMA-11512 TaxID=3095337 RepID=UPI0030905C47|nr:ribose 5-phosphate isomerase B [Selenomonas sp. TAMA-11512]
MTKTIVIGSDHAGYPMKEYLKKELGALGYTFEDKGTHSEDSCSAADFAWAVAEEVAAHPGEKRGIIICATGIAVSVAANKVKGICAALVSDLFTAHATREHNDTNVLCMGQRVIANNMAFEIAKVWLTTEALGGKYADRRKSIAAYEEKHMK